MIRSHRPPILLFGAALACAGVAPDEAPPAPGVLPPAVAAADSAREALPLSIQLPEGFPAEFPVAPRSSVIRASGQPDADGALWNVTIEGADDPAALYAWYRDALGRSGWTVSSEGGSDPSRTLHAARGESYVDLSVGPGEDPVGTRLEAAIWMLNP